MIIKAGVLALVIALATGCASENGEGTVLADDDTEQTTTTRRRPRPTTTTTAAPYEPQPADFTINVLTLEKSCFGSAGCNVTYTIELAYVGAGPLDPSTTYSVTYDVAGGELVQTSTLTVTGDSYSHDEESFISTPAEGAVLTATATMVRAT